MRNKEEIKQDIHARLCDLYDNLMSEGELDAAQAVSFLMVQNNYDFPIFGKSLPHKALSMEDGGDLGGGQNPDEERPDRD